MQEIQDLFHKLNNQLNNISVEAGAIVHTVSPEEVESLSAEDLRREYIRFLEKLAYSEKCALAAGDLSHRMKEIVYEALGIDRKKTE